MSESIKPMLSARYGIEESWELANAERAGAYRVAREALTTRKPAELKDLRAYDLKTIMNKKRDLIHSRQKKKNLIHQKM